MPLYAALRKRARYVSFPSPTSPGLLSPHSSPPHRACSAPRAAPRSSQSVLVHRAERGAVKLARENDREREFTRSDTHSDEPSCLAGVRSVISRRCSCGVAIANVASRPGRKKGACLSFSLFLKGRAVRRRRRRRRRRRKKKEEEGRRSAPRGPRAADRDRETGGARSAIVLSSRVADTTARCSACQSVCASVCRLYRVRFTTERERERRTYARRSRLLLSELRRRLC